MYSNHCSPQQLSPQPIARFDRLGLPISSLPSACPTEIDDVAFQVLRLKRLLESAFQLEGFNQATANSRQSDAVVIEYAASEGLYHSFKNQPLELKMQITITPLSAPALAL